MKISSVKEVGRLSAVSDEPCGWKSPVLRAISVKFVSRPRTISAFDDAPSSWTRPRIPIDESRATKFKSQLHCASNAVSIAGPGPHSEVKLS